MINTILSDFSRVILFPKDTLYGGTLNGLHTELLQKNPEYNIFDYFVINEELLNYYNSLKPKYSVNVFTTGEIQNASQIKGLIEPNFDKILTAKDYGLSKFSPETFKFIAEKLGKNPEEILYIDDTEKNLIAAKEAGFNIFLYQDNKKTIEHLSSMLI